MNIVDPLLTEEFLVENLTVRELGNDVDMSRDDGRSEEEEK